MLPLTVNICTFNRASYLDRVLTSLKVQTLPKDQFEIVLINDGSSDGTPDIVRSHQGTLPIRYFFQQNSGLAAAKDKGIELAKGEIILFFDDDDIASPTLLEEHLKTHRTHPEQNFAVLNYTTWAAELRVTSLMTFLTDVGRYLFSYPGMRDGDQLDYTYFWGGRSSCKRSFLLSHGVFNPIFRFGCEDIELGYRLSKHGLKVVYNSNAVSYMIRPLTLADFLNRLLKQGRSQYAFSKIHNAREVEQWCEVTSAEADWERIKPHYDTAVRSAFWLEKVANAKLSMNLEVDKETERLFYQALWSVFYATKIKGICEARQANSEMGNAVGGRTTGAARAEGGRD